MGQKQNSLTHFGCHLLGTKPIMNVRIMYYILNRKRNYTFLWKKEKEKKNNYKSSEYFTKMRTIYIRRDILPSNAEKFINLNIKQYEFRKDI